MRSWHVASLAAILLWFGHAAPAHAQAAPCKFMLPVSAEDLDLPGEIEAGDCVERDRLTLHDNQYLFVDLAGYDSSATDRYTLIKETVVRGVELYSQWFDVPDVIFVSGDISLGAAGTHAVVLGLATGSWRGCVIALGSDALHAGREGGSDDIAHFRRTVAHELFHCAQINDPTVDNGYVVWRDEGTADFFADLVVPESHADPFFYADMELLATSALYELGYSAYPFVAWLGVTHSVESVVNMLKGASRDGSSAGSAQTLAGLPDAANLFHGYVKAWIDGRLVDGMARPISPPPPQLPDVQMVNDETTLMFPVLQPFLAGFYVYEFGQGVGWKIDYPDVPDLRVSWRPIEGGEWMAMPGTIEACDGPKRGIMLVTSAAPTDAAANYELTVTRDPEGMRNCACPVGSWYMDTEMVRASPLSLTMPGTLEGGTMSLNFNADGTASATYNDIKFRSEIDRDSAIVTVMRGTINFSWVAKPWNAAVSGEPAPSGEGVQALAIERTVTASNVHWRVEFWGRDGMINASERTPPARDQGSIQIATAMCMDGVLTLGQGASAVRHALPPWYGMFKRAG